MKKTTIKMILIGIIFTMLNGKVYADSYYSPGGNKVEEYNNYTIVTNNKIKLYEFYLCYLGDWGIKVDNINQLNNIVETYKELGEYKVKDFGISEIYYNESNSKIIVFNDYSSLIINDKTKLYKFYPTELGDWGIKVDNTDQLIQVIKTYMEIKYDLNIESQNYILNGYL